MQSSGGRVGGLVPSGVGGTFSQTLYFNGQSEATQSVLIAYQNDEGSYTQIAAFKKDKIILSDDTEIKGFCKISGLATIGGTCDIGGNTTIEGNTKISGNLTVNTIYTFSDGSYYLANQMNVTNSGMSMVISEHQTSGSIYETGETSIGKIITTKSDSFSGLTHTRTNAPINANPYDGKIKAGLGIATYNFVQAFSSYSNITATNKTSGG